MTTAERLTMAAENVPKVYEAGKKAEYDAFWDAFQVNGERTNYDKAFYRWPITCFYPKHDIKLKGNASNFMQYFGTLGSETIDLAERLTECGVTLDFSEATDINRAFYWNVRISRLPELNISSATTVNLFISSVPDLRTIDCIVFSDDGSQPASNDIIYNCSKLQHLTVKGVIGKSISLNSNSKLSAESLKSVIAHLKNYSGTDKEYSYTLLFSDVQWSILDESGASPGGGTWREYVQSLGWNT